MSKIKEYRIKAGLTQTQLAKKVGVSRPSIWRYEERGVEPRYGTLMRLATVLDCTVDELMGE